MNVMQSHSQQQYAFVDAYSRCNSIIHIYGPRGVGKTSFIKACLAKRKNILPITIHCHRISSKASLISYILKELNPLNKYKTRRGYNPASKIRDLINKLGSKNIKVILIFENAEELVKHNVFHYLAPLSDFDYAQLILVTCCPIMDLIIPAFTGLLTSEARSFKAKIKSIQLTTWTKEEIIELILKEDNDESDEDYPKFVKNVIQYCHRHDSNDFTILRRKVKNMWSQYKEFCENAEESGDFYSIPKFFQTAFKQDRSCINNNLKNTDSTTWKQNVMIIAAYIASYTRPQHDRTNFVKLQKAHRVRKTEKLNVPTDPKFFSLERLINIYIGLIQHSRCIEGREVSDLDIGTVSTLVDLSIIRLVGDDKSLSGFSKYVIEDYVERSYIRKVANDVGIELSHYMPWWPQDYMKTMIT